MSGAFFFFLLRQSHVYQAGLHLTLIYQPPHLLNAEITDLSFLSAGDGDTGMLGKPFTNQGPPLAPESNSVQLGSMPAIWLVLVM